MCPIKWNVANVTPAFKKQDKSATSYCRHISLTSVVGKMLASIIARGIGDHLEKHNLIHDSQHGFMKGKSCLTNLLSFYTRVIEAADRNENYDVLYLDFCKAFDKVPHHRLLLKLQVHGVDGNYCGGLRHGSVVGSRECKSMVANLKGAMLRVWSPRGRCWACCFLLFTSMT